MLCYYFNLFSFGGKYHLPSICAVRSSFGNMDPKLLCFIKFPAGFFFHFFVEAQSFKK